MFDLILVTNEQNAALCSPDNCNPDYPGNDCRPNDPTICDPYQDE